MTETPRPFTKDLPTGTAGFTLTASAVTEVIAVEDWSNIPADQVFVVTGFLSYGTAGSVTSIELKDGQQTVHQQRNAVEANAQNINQKKVPLSYPVGPGHALRLYFTAGAAPPTDNRVYLEGVFFHVTEL